MVDLLECFGQYGVDVPVFRAGTPGKGDFGETDCAMVPYIIAAHQVVAAITAAQAEALCLPGKPQERRNGEAELPDILT